MALVNDVRVGRHRFELVDLESGIRLAFRGTLAAAEKRAATWARDGSYGDITSTIWIDVGIDYCGERWSKVTVAIDPDAPPCEGGGAHEWKAPYEIVGGIRENPGVVGHGGGVVINEVCRRCGCGKTTDTWAQRRDTGEQGLTSVSYTVGKYADELAALAEEDDS